MQEKVTAAEPKVSDLDILRHQLAIAGQSVRSERAGVTKNHMRPRNKKRAHGKTEQTDKQR